MEFHHQSVLLQESVQYLNIRPNGVYADGTLGGGGHSSLICSKLSENGHLIGIDRDSVALKAATDRLQPYTCRKTLIHGNFFNITEILRQADIPGLDGAILDLGVSSPQLDDGERGFSYHQTARLDMRMNQEDALTAYDVVNTYSKEQLAGIISRYGEERYAGRVAAEIVSAREKSPIQTTTELADCIKRAFPPKARYGDKHPAKRTFQAIRIEVNRELDGLGEAIKAFVSALKPGGRLAVISFHSLEDRIVKTTFAELSEGCICPKDFPTCVCGRKPVVLRVTRKPITAGEEELSENNRAHSAKLRVIEKL